LPKGGIVTSSNNDRKSALIVQLQEQLDSTKALDNLAPTSGGMTFTINGHNYGDGAGIGNTIIRTEKVIQQKKVEVKTGDGVITAEQKARLHQLVKEWVALYNTLHKHKKTLAAAWSSVNRQAKVNSYHEISADKFDAIEKWLLKQIAIKNAMPSAKKKSSTWRAGRIKGIQSRCNELGIQDKRKEYMKKNFGKDSLTLLSDDDIEKVYRWVMSKK
jgi:UTP-glucose-1-phosphate uridylyltransferase